MIHKRFIDKCLKSIPYITESPIIIESIKQEEDGFFSELLKNDYKYDSTNNKLLENK